MGNTVQHTIVLATLRYEAWKNSYTYV
jgi:hypothetical protein